jgi:transcriptional regulator with XRE-family HTH domain
MGVSAGSASAPAECRTDQSRSPASRLPALWTQSRSERMTQPGMKSAHRQHILCGKHFASPAAEKEAHMGARRSSCDRTIGARLRLRRRERAMSVDQLAAALDVEPSDIAAFEDGAERIGAVRLAVAGRALRTPIAYFFKEVRRVDAGRRFDSPEAASARHDLAELLSAYSRIESSPLRAAVLELAQELARKSSESASRAAVASSSRPHHSRSHLPQ